jgi:hypothetical protein
MRLIAVVALQHFCLARHNVPHRKVDPRLIRIRPLARRAPRGWPHITHTAPTYGVCTIHDHGIIFAAHGEVLEALGALDRSTHQFILFITHTINY